MIGAIVVITAPRDDAVRMGRLGLGYTERPSMG
jgi:hypothetical protein